MEAWLPVKGWEDRYEVSDLGKVRRKMPAPATRFGRILKPSCGRGHYGHVTLSAKNIRYTVRVHTLVATAFLGDAPTPNHEVNHRDGNKQNNEASNLEWVLPAENQAHAHLHGLKPRGMRTGAAKLTDGHVQAIRLLQGLATQREIGRMFGVSKTVIGLIHRGQTWAHVP